MPKPFRVVVFGKAGCDKCRTLNQRLDRILAGPDGELFDKLACDLMTVDGLVDFCEAECINPQRIPAMLVARWDDRTGGYEPVPRPASGGDAPHAVLGKSALYLYEGLQTDYSDAGKGVISPKMIEAVLADARASAQAA